MGSWKWKILFPVITLTILVAAKFILWDYPVSSGKRVGNLTKISKKGKIWFTKTWEGTIDEGSGDKLTTFFSVRDDKLGEELYAYEGKEVILKYNQHFMGWPRDTNYDVVEWTPKDAAASSSTSTSISNDLDESKAVGLLSKTLFCALLGSLYQDQELYMRVKDYLKENNLYLYNQIENCND